MRGCQIRAGLRGEFGQAIGFRGVFDAEIEINQRQQAFRIELGHCFGLMSSLRGRRPLAAHEEIHRNAGDHFDEQTIGHVGRRLGQSQTKLLQAAVDFVRLQFLIAEQRMSNDQEFVCARRGD